VFGEQVASKDAEPWLDLVCTDLEALGYAFGAVAFPAAGVGAPHIRERSYWLADANSDERAQGFTGSPRETTFVSGVNRESIGRQSLAPGNLAEQVELYAWHSQVRVTNSGATMTGYSVTTENDAQLDPELSRWLMSIPPEWRESAPTEMRLSRNKRKSS